MDNRIHRFCLLAAFGCPLAVYYATAAPGAFWEDSAAFSMAAATLSLPHSPGFPLWVLIGKLFTWLIPHNPARATNLMCGFFGAGGAALFYLCVQMTLTRLSDSFTPVDNAGKIYSAPTIALTALGAALVFAFSQTVWLQAVRAEVYSLQMLMTLSILLITLSLDKVERPTRFFLLAAFLWGLSLAVHPLLSLSVLPGLLMLGCFKSANWKKELAKWGWVMLLVFTAVTAYLYLPIRSNLDPYFNWNQPDNWERFWAAVSRSGSWEASAAATSTNVSYANFMRLTHFMSAEYSFLFWAVAIFGIVRLTHFLPKAGLGIFVLSLSNFSVVLWAVSFDSWNMDLLGYLSFGSGLAILSAAAGLFELINQLGGPLARLRPMFGWLVPATVAAFAFFLADKNWARADLHKSFWPEKIARETLLSLPPNAVVCYSYDRFLTPTLYVQGALGVRPDVTILLVNVFFDPVVMQQTLRRNPDLAVRVYRTKTVTPARMQKGFRAFCRENRRPIFSQLGEHLSHWEDFRPAGYLVEYHPEGTGMNAAQKVIGFLDTSMPDDADFLTREALGMEIHNWGAYLSKIGAPGAETLFQKEAELDGDNPRMWVTLGKAYFSVGQFRAAEACLQQALNYDPYWGEAYYLLADALEMQGKIQEAEVLRAEASWLAPKKPGSLVKR